MLPKKLILIAILILALGSAGFVYYVVSSERAREFRVTFLNIGQGDSALIRFGNGQKMLVDCGKDALVLARLGQALPLWERTIDYLVATHPDLDHYGGCVDVLKRYQVKHIVTNGRKKPDAYWREFDRAARAERYQESWLFGGAGRPAEVIVMASPTRWVIGSSTLEFFSPDPVRPLAAGADDSNNYSIVFKLTGNSGQTFLFTADMEEPLERALLQRYCPRPALPCPLQARILKVGHHGSDSSTSEALLVAVRPARAVISVGKNNYGHPSRRVIKHLERAGAEILRTDERGDIAIEK